MKKLLALVLALVMTLGLATVSSSAAYSDKADIEYTEAADVMTALGVFQGKGDAFAPKDNLNRAEAAKLIAYLMLGNKTAESMTGSGTRFTDVPASHWAAGFIEYLASVGIVSGVGNNQFNPNGQVTAVQFAKMLLVALGYDADLEGFVGEGWSINIQKLANKNDLFETLDIGTNDALTREQAAQMCLNDLKADMVKYSDKGTTVKIGESTVVTGAKEAAKDEDVGNKNYNNSKDANGDKKYLQLAESLYGNDIKLDEGRDDFGRPTNTWNYKNIKVGEYTDNAQLIATATEKFSRKSLYDALGKDQYDNIKDGKTALYAYEDGVETRVTAANLDTYMDRNDTSAISNSGNGSLTQVYLNDNDANDVVRVVTSHTYIWQVTNDYNATRGDVTIKAVAKAGDTPALINLNDKTLKDDDFEEVKDLKKDDYVLVTAYVSGAGYDVDSIAKAELKSGKVTSFTKDDTVTIDGEKLKYAKMVPTDTDNKKATYTVGEEARFVMDKYGYIIAVDEAVVNNNYVFIANIASTNGLNNNPEGDAYFTDGTNEAIRINKLIDEDGKSKILGDTSKVVSYSGNASYAAASIGAFGEASTHTTSSNAGWYTYSKTSDGKYNLSKVNSDYKQVGYVFDAKGGNILKAFSNNTVKFMKAATEAIGSETLSYMSYAKASVPAANTLLANDKTVFVVEQDGDVNVYTGIKNAPEINLKSVADNALTLTVNENETESDKAVVVVTYDDSGTNKYAKYVYVTLTDDADVDGGENTALFYLLKQDTEDVIADQKDYDMWYMIDESGKDVLVKTDAGFLSGGPAYKAYYKVYKNSEDEYSKVTTITSAGNADTNYYYAGGEKYIEALNNDENEAISFSDGSLFLAGEGFSVKDDTKIILVITANGMKTNTDKKYEIEIYTGDGDGFAQKFDDYSKYTYNVQGRVNGNFKSDNNRDLKEVYVTVTAATKKTSGAAPAVYSDKISKDAFVGTDAEFMKTLQSMLNKGNVTITDNNVSLPNTGSTLIIPTGNTLTVKNLTNDAKINVKGILKVTGDLDDNNHIDVNGGMVVDGTGAKIAGYSIVIAKGATVEFTNPAVAVRVTGNLEVNGALVVGGTTEDTTNATTASLVVEGSKAEVTFGSTADVTIEGSLSVGAEVKTFKTVATEPVVIAGDSAIETITTDSTGTISVGGTDNNNAAAMGASKATSESNELTEAKATAKEVVANYVKTFKENEFVVDTDAAKESDVKAAIVALDKVVNGDAEANPVVKGVLKEIDEAADVDAVEAIAKYTAGSKTYEGTGISAIKTAGDTLVAAAKAHVVTAKKGEVTEAENGIDDAKTSATALSLSEKVTTVSSAKTTANSAIDAADTIAKMDTAINTYKTACETFVTDVKKAEADAIAAVKTGLASGVTIDANGGKKDVFVSKVEGQFAAGGKGAVKITSIMNAQSADLTDAMVAAMTTSPVTVKLSLECGTTTNSEIITVVVTIGA